MSEPPLVNLFPNEDPCEFSNEIENNLSVERTGYGLTRLIGEISDRLAVVTGDTKDSQNLTEAYVSGEITKIASRILEKTIAESDFDGGVAKLLSGVLVKNKNSGLFEDLTKKITRSIYYEILNIIEVDKVAITKGVLTELPTLLGISSDTLTQNPPS